MDNNLLKKLHSAQLEILDEIVRICEMNDIGYFLIGGTLLGAIRHNGFIPWDDDLDIAMTRNSYDKFLEICKIQLNNKFILDYDIVNQDYWLPFAKVRKKDTIYEQPFQRNKNDYYKGIWVDIFPLDNVKYKKSFLQEIQARIIYNIRKVISVKMGYEKCNNLKEYFFYAILRFFDTNFLFSIQRKTMKFWSKKKTNFLTNLGSQYGHVKQTFHKSNYFPLQKHLFEGKLYCIPHEWDYILKRIYGDYMKLPPEDKRVTHSPVRIKFEDGEEIKL